MKKQHKPSISTDLLFDGYCPESALQGKKVIMRVNADDFWESPDTGLLITAFPPFATILRWRGKGQFKLYTEVASDYCQGLLLTRACQEKGLEIYPDEKEILDNTFDLEQYLSAIYESEESYFKSKFDYSDPQLKKQAAYLETIVTEEWVDLLALYHQIRTEGVLSPELPLLSDKLYQLQIIFDFNWIHWLQGLKSLESPEADFPNATLLDISMYLTLIFRKERYSEGSIKRYLKNGLINNLFQRLENIT